MGAYLNALGNALASYPVVYLGLMKRADLSSPTRFAGAPIFLSGESCREQ